MAANASSFLSRFSLSRDTSSILPLYSQSRSAQPSAYDLDDLSARSEQDEPRPSGAGHRSVDYAYEDRPLPAATSASASRASSTRRSYEPESEAELEPEVARSSSGSQMKPSVLFAGPPPPIATSVLMFRDVEDRGGRSRESSARRGSTSSSPASLRLPAHTVLLSPNREPTSGRRGAEPGPGLLDGDSTWALLQRRERALQKDVQEYLDIQSAGLSAGLGRGPRSPSVSPSPSLRSNPGRNRGWTSAEVEGTGTSARSVRLRLPTERSTATGAVIPVRQPRPRRLGLRAARAGLARSMARLADLRAEEDAALAAALQARQRALTHLRRLSGRHAGIERTLKALESDDDEPLTRELVTLRRAHASTNQQIADLEGQLAMLRQRKRTLEGRIEDAASQRESGLSGYRGALKEVEAQLDAVLRRPPIQPLAVDAVGRRTGRAEGPGVSDGAEDKGRIRLDDRDDAENEDEDASAGLDFLRLLPERRTAEMAKLWWESEARLLERRRSEVAAEREALDAGAAVWLAAVQLVSGFEADLRKEMAMDKGDKGEVGDDGGQGDGHDSTPAGADASKGKERARTPEKRMRDQLARMATVMAGLQAHLQTAEDRGWNLLICALGAELEAFREARDMLRLALRAAGIVVEDSGGEDDGSAAEALRIGGDGTGDSGSGSGSTARDGDTAKATQLLIVAEAEDTLATPRLARSSSDAPSALSMGYNEHSFRTASEGESNDVPPDLLVAPEDEHDRQHQDERQDGHGHGSDSLHDRDDSSENEVPPEFLLESS